MTPEERAENLVDEWVIDNGGFAVHRVAAEIRAAVEEEREVWIAQLKEEVRAAQSKLLTTNDAGEQKYWEGFRDAAEHAIRARGKEKDDE